MILWLFIYFLVYSNIDAMTTFFFATLTFNLAVLTVLTIGIIMVMKAAINLVMLAGTFGTLAYKKNNLSFYLKDIDKIMPANIAHMFHTRAEKGVLLFTAEESRDVIEWIEEKFSHQNRYTNYFIGTVLMIGLLGTFSGLLVAIDSMGRIILSLTGDIDLGKVLADFAGPLSGMAVGFGSSLFGVIAAIILGLKGYILNKNQEALIEGVEDWLKGRIIDVGSTSSSSTNDGNNLPEHKSSFMDVFIDNIASLSQEMAKISQTNERLHSITIASVQQTRDEHEINLELFEEIAKSLKSIDTNAQETTKVFSDQFSTLQNSIHTDTDSSLKQQQEVLVELFEKLEQAMVNSQNAMAQHFEDQGIKLDKDNNVLRHIHQLLNQGNEASTEQLRSVVESLSALMQAVQTESKTLQTLEKLQKMQVSGTQKQGATMEKIHESLLSTQDNNVKQERHLKTINGELTSVRKQVAAAQERSITTISEKIEALEKLLAAETQNIKAGNELQGKSSDLATKQKEILEQLLSTQEESSKTLTRIETHTSATEAKVGQLRSTSADTSSNGETHHDGLFSKIFK